MFSIIQAAGWPIWPLLACSIVALALVIERFLNPQTMKVAPPKLLGEVLASVRPHARLEPETNLISFIDMARA